MSEDDEASQNEQEHELEAIRMFGDLERKLESMEPHELMKFGDTSKPMRKLAAPFLENKLTDYNEVAISVCDDGVAMNFTLGHEATAFNYKKKFNIGNNMSLEECKEYLSHYISLFNDRLYVDALLKSNRSQLILQALRWFFSYDDDDIQLDSMEIYCEEPNNELFTAILNGTTNDLFFLRKVTMNCAPHLPSDLDVVDWDPAYIGGLVMKQSEWVTLDHLQGIFKHCAIIVLEEVNLTIADINAFLKSQRNPSDSTLETLKFRFDGDLTSLLADLNAEQIGANDIGQYAEFEQLMFEQPVFQFQCGNDKEPRIVFVYQGYFHMMEKTKLSRDFGMWIRTSMLVLDFSNVVCDCVLPSIRNF